MEGWKDEFQYFRDGWNDKLELFRMGYGKEGMAGEVQGKLGEMFHTPDPVVRFLPVLYLLKFPFIILVI